MTNTFRLFALIVVYLTGMLWLHGGLPWDDAIENWFFTSPCNLPEPRDCWLISKTHPGFTFWLHTVPRILAWGGGSISAIALVAGYYLPRLRPYRRHFLLVLIGIAATSALIAIMKQFTGHYCPGQLLRYGGMVGDVVLQHPAPRCFPAGHPAPGWGLLVLCFTPVSRSWRRFGFWGGIAFGGTLSFVQMARGEHFLSHILATLLTALFIGGVVWVVTRSRLSSLPALSPSPALS